MEKSHNCHEPTGAHAHHHSAPGAGPWRLAAQSTLHCLTGCVIGEVIGLAIGIEMGLSAVATTALATTLAYFSGFALGLWPVTRIGSLVGGSGVKVIARGGVTQFSGAGFDHFAR